MPASRPASESGLTTEESFETLLLSVDELGRTTTDPAVYYRELANVILQKGPFASVAVWAGGDHHVSLKATAPESNALAAPALDVWDRALTGRAIELSSDTNPPNGTLAHHAARLLAGYRIDRSDGIALEATVHLASSMERPGRLLEALAELIGHVETRFRYLVAKQAVAALETVDLVIQNLASGESLVETSLLIAAAVRDELGFDRAWVCRPQRGGSRIIATGETGDIARRQLLSKKVENAAALAISTGRDWKWSAGEPAAEATTALRALAEEGTARRICVLPLFDRSTSTGNRPLGAIVLEQFADVARTDEAIRWQALRPHVERAFAQAWRHDQAGWRGRLARADASAWGRAAVLGVLVLAGMIFLAWPVPFEIEAEGQLVPVQTRSVFAPADGVVATIHTRHGASVTAADPILEIRSPALDLDRERLTGQIAELKAKLASSKVLRTQGRRPPGESATSRSADEDQLIVALDGAEKQLALVLRERATLTVVSPIAGVVDRWDFNESLSARPVVRGQHLCDVLDVAGPWKLDLHVPDQRAGDVQAALVSTSTLPLRFVLRTDPQSTYHTRLESFADRTELNEQGQLTVRAGAAVPPGLIALPRAGSSVVARIDCGVRRRAFVWFHDVWNSLRYVFL